MMFNNSDYFATLFLENDGTAGTIYPAAATKAPVSLGLSTVLRAQGPGGVCGINGGGDVACTGQIKSLVSTGGGARKVETYAVQSPENWIEDFGSGSLERGVAVVSIDPAFAETVSETADYHVFLTPKGDSKGLYVTNETAAGFEVRESGGGVSSLSFDYRIVGKRRGYEAERLTDVTDRYNAEAEAVAPRGDGGARRPRRVPAQRAAANGLPSVPNRSN
jgi:hypothetical protein